MDLLQRRPRAPEARPSPVPKPRQSFSILLEPAGLRMTVGLEELAFVLDVVRQDGTLARLPCPLLPLETEHIASELTARMRSLRAAQADYRGAST